MISQMLLLICLANSFGVQAGASVWVRVGTHAQCDVSQGEKYLAGSSGSVADEAACKRSCDDEDDCRTVTYFGKSKWCSHFSTACEKTIHVSVKRQVMSYATRATTTAGAPPKSAPAGAIVWIRLGVHNRCDITQGEKYLAGSSGPVADEAACKKSCEDEDDCKTVTYFGKSEWCSHFSTKCTKRSYVSGAYSYTFFFRSRTTAAALPPKSPPTGVVIEIAWLHQTHIVHNSLNMISSSLVSPVCQCRQWI